MRSVLFLKGQFSASTYDWMNTERKEANIMSIPRAENVSRHLFLPRSAKDPGTAYSRKEDRMPDLIVALFSDVGCLISYF